MTTSSHAQPSVQDAGAREPRVHALPTGWLSANATFLRGEGLLSLLRRPQTIEFPALAYALEFPDGLIVIDTGLAADTPSPRRLRGFPPAPLPGGEEIGERMRAVGLDPADVRTVVLNHLDWDHTGGLWHFPHAEVLVHRPEFKFARSLPGRLRYRPELWPGEFSPTLYDLDPEPYGPFPSSRPIDADGEVRIVPIPGHSPGQVGVVCRSGDVTLLFAADHALRADWFADDVAADRLVMLGAFGKKQSRQTSERLRAFIEDRATVLLPAHDATAPDRLARREVTRL